MNENESENHKRASTISIPAKLGASQANCNSSNQQGSINNNNVRTGSVGNSGGKAKSEKRVSYVGFEDGQENNGTSRSSVFLASASGHFSPITEQVDQLKTSAWLSSQQQSNNNNISQQNSSTTTAGEVENFKSNNFALSDETGGGPSKVADATLASPANKQTGSGGGSSRRKIAAYLTSKLYNLTNLASGSANSNSNSNSSSTNIHNQASNYSMSAPPSPLNKRASSSSAGGSNSGHSGAGGASNKRQPLRQSIYGADCQLPFYLSKDYGACDFILFVESTSVKQQPLMSMSAKSSMTTSSGATLQTQIHHHASNIASAGNYSANLTSGTTSHNSSSMGGGNSSQFGGSGANFAFGSGSGPIIIHLIAPNLQEKAAWMSDISQVSNLDELSRGSSLFVSLTHKQQLEAAISSFRLAFNSF